MDNSDHEKLRQALEEIEFLKKNPSALAPATASQPARPPQDQPTRTETLASSAFHPAQTKYLDVNLDRTLIIWWAIAWRQLVFGLLAGAVLGFGSGFILGLAGHAELAPAIGMLLGWLAMIPISIVVLRIVLQKKFQTFSICLISNQ